MQPILRAQASPFDQKSMFASNSDAWLLSGEERLCPHKLEPLSVDSANVGGVEANHCARQRDQLAHLEITCHLQPKNTCPQTSATLHLRTVFRPFASVQRKKFNATTRGDMKCLHYSCTRTERSAELEIMVWQQVCPSVCVECNEQWHNNTRQQARLPD